MVAMKDFPGAADARKKIRGRHKIGTVRKIDGYVFKKISAKSWKFLGPIGDLSSSAKRSGYTPKGTASMSGSGMMSGADEFMSGAKSKRICYKRCKKSSKVVENKRKRVVSKARHNSTYAKFVSKYFKDHPAKGMAEARTRMSQAAAAWRKK